MRKKLTISIVTPSYNQGNYIEDTYNSILKQKLGDGLEYIIVDANSTDNTLEITRQFIPKFKKNNIKVKFIREKDKGQSDAINKGWRLSEGDILGYLNSDDFYEEDMLSVVIDYFEQNPKVKWVYGGWQLTNASGKVIKIFQPHPFTQAELLNHNFIGQPSCFFRREILFLVGYLNINLHLSMDYDFWLRIGSKYTPGYIEKIISNSRLHPNCKSRKYEASQAVEMLKVASQYTPVISRERLSQYYYFSRWIMGIAKHKLISLI